MTPVHNKELRTSTCLRVTIGLLEVLAITLVIIGGILLSQTAELRSDVEHSLHTMERHHQKQQHGIRSNTDSRTTTTTTTTSMRARDRKQQQKAARDIAEQLHFMMYHHEGERHDNNKNTAKRSYREDDTSE